MSDIIDKIRNMKKEYSDRQVPQVKFTPLEKTPEEKPKEEQKSKGSLLSKLKSTSSVNVKSELDEEKEAIKEDYLTLYRNQMKASNLVLADTMLQIEKVFRDMLKEDESYDMDGYLLQPEKAEKAVKRNSIREYYQITKTQLAKAITDDVVKFFSQKYQEISDLENDEIEIVRKVKFTRTALTLTTDEGVYEFDSKKAAYNGGYIFLNRNIFTEELELDKIATEIVGKNAKKKADAQNRSWLLVSPMLIRVSDDKVIMMPMGYLKDSLAELLTTIAKRTALKNKMIEKNKLKDEQAEVDNAISLSPREIVEELIKGNKEPVNRALILYPYNKLKENGVDFESDIDFSEQSYITSLEEVQSQSPDFISWNSVNKLREVTSIEDKIFDIMEMLKFTEKPDLIHVDAIADEDLENVVKDIEDEEDEESEVTSKTTVDEDDEEDEDEVGQRLAQLTGTGEESKSNKKGKSKKTSLEQIDKKNRDKIKKHYKALRNLEYSKVIDLIDAIKNTKYSDRDWRITTNIIRDMIENQKFSKDDELYIKYLSDEMISNQHILVSVDELIDNLVKARIDTLEELNKFIEEFSEHYNKALDIQSVIGSVIAYPYLNNLNLKIKSGYASLSLASVIIDGLVKRDEMLKSEIEDLQKYPIPIINPKLNKSDYDKIKLIVKHLGDRNYVNWMQILKIVALRDSAMIKSYVEFHDDIRELLNIPELREDMTHLNNMRKFINPKKEEELEETLFNRMITEITIKRKGLLCAIDYRGLISYVVNTEEPLKGEEIVKYIPAMNLVDKYFPITESSRVYDKVEPERIVAELSTMPATYLAMTHILHTIENSLKFEDELFKDSYEDIKAYETLRKEMNTFVNASQSKAASSLDAEYANILNELKTMLKTLRGKRNFKVKQDASLYLPVRTNEAIEYILDNPQYFKFGDSEAIPPVPASVEIGEFRSKFNELKEKSSLLLVQLDEERKKSEENREKYIRELSEKINQAKNAVDTKVGAEVDKIINRLSVYYNYQISANDLTSAWKHYNFDTFQKGKILFNFINTYTQDNSEIVKSAILQIVRQYLLDSKEIMKVLLESGKSEAEATENIFSMLLFMFRLDRILPMEASDRLNLETALRKDKPQEMSEEDRAVLNLFLQQLNGKSDVEISTAFREFERKDLIDDELYLNVAYNNVSEAEEMYPAWYSRDFNLAENIKIMLLCGIPADSLNKIHREDKKLMSIVESTEIDEGYIQRLKDLQD